MAKTIKVSTLARWVYLDDNGEVVEAPSPAEAPEGATLFRLRPISADFLVHMGIAGSAGERALAIGGGSRRAVAEIRGLTDQDGNPLKVAPEDVDSYLQAMPLGDQLALSNYVQRQVEKQIEETAEARRGNEPSGTSQGKKRSGGASTAGSRTALRATN